MKMSKEVIHAMRILIADDELLVRIGIKSCIEWEKHGMEVVGEAEDGASTMELIRMERPDALLLDIKMPVMNGLDVLRRIREEGIDCKVVVLSSFDDLEYVKEAMKLGAVDYLHKPRMGSQDILGILKNVKDLIENGKVSESNESLSQVRPEHRHNDLKDIFLRELVKGGIPGTAEFRAMQEREDIRLKNTNFCCIVFAVSSYKEVKDRYRESNENLLQSSISNIMNEILANEDGVDFFRYDENIYVVITSSAGAVSRQNSIDKVNGIINLISDAFRQFLNIGIDAGVSDICISFKDIKAGFKQAYEALKYRFYLRDGGIINYCEIKHLKNDDSRQLLGSVVKSMKTCAADGDFDDFISVLDNLFDFLIKEQCMSEGEVKKLLDHLLFFIKPDKSWIDEMESINACESMYDVREVYRKIILDNTNAVDGRCVHYNYLTKKIIDFIEKNYSREITLKLLSQNLNVSPNYISRLFKEDTGQSLFEYINEVRINKAKKLLKNGELKINEVGYRVGFKSPVHFDIVFNKFTGLSPKQYREKFV